MGCGGSLGAVLAAVGMRAVVGVGGAHSGGGCSGSCAESEGFSGVILGWIHHVRVWAGIEKGVAGVARGQGKGRA